MTQFLPSNLLALFAPREPLKYLPPTEKLPHEKNLPVYTGVAAFLNHFESARDVPPPTRVETKDERKERQKKERAEQVAYKLEQDLAMWDPLSDPSVSGDPYKTLFCARINYDTSESKLRREFDVYGTVKRLRMVVNKDSGKPRGYAFVEFEHERDMHAAYKHADGKKIDGRRVLVDVERGRTVKGWRPRRLAGGIGSTRRGGGEAGVRASGREEVFRDSRDIVDERRVELERYPRRTRSRSKERERGGERDKDRDRDRRRSRSRERERRRRSRERRRTPEREIVKKEPLDELDVKTEPGLEDDKEGIRKRRRSRSRDRSRRSRSRDRKRSRRSRSRDRKDRDRRRGGESNGAEQPAEEKGPFIKQELQNMEEYAAQEGEGYEGEEGEAPPYGARLEDL